MEEEGGGSVGTERGKEEERQGRTEVMRRGCVES